MKKDERPLENCGKFEKNHQQNVKNGQKCMRKVEK